MGNQMVASARELMSNHERIANETGYNITANRDWQYIMVNGPTSVTAGYRHSLDSMVQRYEWWIITMHPLLVPGLT